VETRVVSLLYSDQVALVRDDHGRLPFDVLLQSAPNLPPKEPQSRSIGSQSSQEESKVYQQFLDASLRGGGKKLTKPQARQFLRRLRSLPPWLRRQACSSITVQDLLVEDLTDPWKCFFVLFEGLLVLALITVFRLQINEYIDSTESGVSLSKWYTFCGTCSANARLSLSCTRLSSDRVACCL
jgi:hypothetical protein